MIFAISKFIASMFGLDISKVQRWVVIIVGCIAVAVILGVVIGTYSCLRKTPKLDIKNIEKINKANETERRAELQKVIEQNADVVKTVDGRNAISEQDEASRQLAIYQKIQDADEKIQAAKSQGKDVTGEQLECILIPENCK